MSLLLLYSVDTSILEKLLNLGEHPQCFTARQGAEDFKRVMLCCTIHEGGKSSLAREMHPGVLGGFLAGLFVCVRLPRAIPAEFLVLKQLHSYRQGLE